MRVHVVRDSAIPLGQATWVELVDDIAFYLSADGASAIGCRALQSAWSLYVDAGAWVWLGPGARPDPTLATRYWSTDHLPARRPVVITYRAAKIKGLLSAEHFHPITAGALTKLTNECAAQGWYAAQPHAAAQ